MHQVTDNILIDKRAFEVFFKEHYSAMTRFAYGFMKDADDAEEMVQNCFVKLWENRETIEIGSAPKSYLFKMIRNACLNQFKHIEVREGYKLYNESVREEPEDDGEMDTHYLQDKINSAIENMPPQRKKIFEMSRFEGLKYKEIATHLNISVKTVENHMGSAMKYLRVELKDYAHLAFVIYLIEGLGDKVSSTVLWLVS